MFVLQQWWEWLSFLDQRTQGFEARWLVSLLAIENYRSVWAIGIISLLQKNLSVLEAGILRIERKNFSNNELSMYGIMCYVEESTDPLSVYGNNITWDLSCFLTLFFLFFRCKRSIWFHIMLLFYNVQFDFFAHWHPSWKWQIFISPNTQQLRNVVQL